MIEHVHRHIIEELRINTRTDTVFVITALMLNLVTLGVNAAVASAADTSATTIVMFLFAALIVVVNLVAEIGLIKGRQTRTKLLRGLIKMYEDSKVAAYYDPSLLEAYKVRYNLFMLTVLFTGILAITIPFIIR
jgi:uncharacterized transporter YbjL